MADPGWLLGRAEETWERHRDTLEPLARQQLWGGFTGGARWMQTALDLLRHEANKFTSNPASGLDELGRAVWLKPPHGEPSFPSNSVSKKDGSPTRRSEARAPYLNRQNQGEPNPATAPASATSHITLHTSHISFGWHGFAKYAAATLAGLAALAPGLWLGPPWLWAGMPLAVLLFYAVEAQGVFLFPAALDGSPTPWKTSRRLMLRSGGTIFAVPTILRLAFRMLTGGFLGGGFVRSWCLGCLAVLIWHERARGEGWTWDEASLPKLSSGGRGPLLVRVERVPLAKARGRIAFASDLHWNGLTPADAAAPIIAALQAAQPDAIVLGGDLADTRAGLPAVAALVASLTKQFPVFFLPGNHDEAVGLDLFRDTLERAGAVWLESWTPPGRPGWSLAGPSSPAAGATIRCRHDPARWKNDSAEITLAGHLHGGQWEFWRSGGRHFPAAWFYRWCGLRFNRDGRVLLVSRGLGDTFPLRWKTPREILVLELGGPPA